jgi:hypothetical protein
LIFFSVDEFVVFQTPITYGIDVMLDFLFFVFMGVVGAGFWRRYGQSPHNLTFSSGTEEEGATRHVDKVMRGKDEPLPSLFSFTDFIRGLYGLPTSSGGDGQHIVYQANGDVQRPFTAPLPHDVLALTH